MNKKLFGQKIKELRKTRKLTQEQLAELIGTDDKHISALERGIYFPKYENIEKLATVFNVELHELFYFVDYRNEEFLLNQSINILKRADYNKLRIAYRLLNDIIN